MKNKTHTTFPPSFLSISSSALLLLLLSACAPSEAPPTAAQNSAFIAERFLRERPEGAIPVRQVRDGLKPGDPATLSGVIGGTLEPFVDGYAAFILADSTLLFCNEMPDDHCDTPWDACCEDPEKLKANRVSVQFVDADNQVLNEGLKGIGGLKELSEVIVTGTLAMDSTPGNRIFLAQKLYLVEKPNAQQ